MINKRLILAASIAVSLMPGLALAQGNNDFAPTNTQNDTPPPMPPPREGPSAEPGGGGKRFGQGGPGQGGFRGGGFRGGAQGGQGFGGPGERGPGQGDHKARMLQRFDTNGNGVLDDSEKAQRDAFKAQHGKGRRNSGLQGGPPDGGGQFRGGARGGQDGGMSDRIKKYMSDGPTGGGPGRGGMGGGRRKHGDGQIREKMMKRFDANGDGQLDAQEQAAADAARRARREQRMQSGGKSFREGGTQDWGQGRRRDAVLHDPDTAQPGK